MKNKFVAPFEVNNDFFNNFNNDSKVDFQKNELFINLNKVFSPLEIKVLLQELDKQSWQTVGVSGYEKDYLADTSQVIGSYRASLYSQKLAEIIWSRISGAFKEVVILDGQGNADWDGHSKWQAVSVNPLMRFIKYLPGGSLIPHYDSPYVYNESKKTLMSLVIYLSQGEEGSTRFIQDSQNSLPLSQRNFSDWERKANPEEIKNFKKPVAGEAIAFFHRHLHDSEDLVKEVKIILRTDIDFMKV